RRAMQLWLHYNLACLRDIAASGARVGALSFHSLLVEPSSTIADAIDTDLSAEAESQISEYIVLGDNHFLKPAASLDRAPHIPAAIKDMWRLLEDWNGLAADVRMRRLTEIGNAYDEAMLLAGHILRPRIP